MKINTPNKKRKVALLTGGILVLLISAAGLAYYFLANKPYMTEPTQQPQVAPAINDGPTADQKQAIIDANDNKKTPDKSQNNNTASSLSLELSRKSNDIVVVTKLNDIGDGICKLTAKNGDKTYERSVTVIYQSEYSTCAGFSIPVTALGSGKWTVSVKATSLKNVSATKVSTIEVEN